jgi:hypothetical protein
MRSENSGGRGTFPDRASNANEPANYSSGSMAYSAPLVLFSGRMLSQKVIPVLLVFLGETLSIVAELIASKRAAAANPNLLSIFLLMFIPIAIGGACLVVGYMLGYVHLKNIWIVAAISVGSILIIEPILAFVLFRQLPTLGASIGLACGVLGTFAALVL